MRNNPLLCDIGVVYGFVAVARACEEVLGLPVPLVTTGSEASRVIEHLAAKQGE